MAQQYITHPYLIDGYKFDVRVWLLVSGRNPCRVYVHKYAQACCISNLNAVPCVIGCGCLALAAF